MAKYKLIINEVADQNLFDLYCDGVIQWGVDQATIYYDAFYRHFENLCDNPFLYQGVDEIREGYRRSICGKHSVYYRVIETTVEIMAVLRYENPAEYFEI